MRALETGDVVRVGRLTTRRRLHDDALRALGGLEFQGHALGHDHPEGGEPGRGGRVRRETAVVSARQHDELAVGTAKGGKGPCEVGG